MAEYLTSVKGRRLGLDPNDNLLVRNVQTGGEMATGPGTNSTAKLRTGGVASISTSLVISSATTVAQTYATYSVPKSTIGETGGRLVFTAWGTFGSNVVNIKSVRVVVGGNTFTTGSSSYSGGGWIIQREVVRTGANAQTIFTQATVGASNLTGPIGGNAYIAQDISTDTSVDTDTITITVSATEGSGTVTNQIALKGYKVEYYPPSLG